MFLRIKNITSPNGDKCPYIYLVKSVWTKKGSRQRVVKYLGRAKHVGVLRKETIQRVFKKYNYQCAICLSPDNPSEDHIIPLSLGGTNEESNLQVLCVECNQRKRDLILHVPKFKRKPQTEKFLEKEKIVLPKQTINIID